MNKCPKCGTEFEGTFCPECGTKWMDKKTCPGCGARLDGSAKFCTYCGKSFYAPSRPAPKPKKKRSFKRWVSEHKKLFGFLIAAFVLVLILSVVIPIVIIHRHDGTYYLYSNEQYDYETYLILNGNSYTDETGYSCDVEFDGNQIKLYGEIFGIKDIIANGTIDGDVMRLKIMDTVVIYAKKDHVHKYEQKTIQEPTCNQEGIVAKVCQTCGFQMRDEIEKIAPLGHDFQNHVCTRCGVNSNILLEYSMVADGSGYIVTGLGSCPEKEIIIPNEYRGISVTSIGAEAFSGYDTLISVTIGSNVTSIGESAFYGCERLASITIGSNVTSIGLSAFGGCSGLTSVTIPNSVTSIGDSAFENCYGLTLVTIPDSVTSIGYAAFGSCDGLTEITIPDSVTSIGYGAFGECSGLTSVIIGNSVTSIETYAFAWCEGLTSIKFNGTTDEWKAIKKDSYWKYGSPIQEVICTNGTLTGSDIG